MNDYVGSVAGDVVVHHMDSSNNIICYGTVIETKGVGLNSDRLVAWSSESTPLSWHYAGELTTVSYLIEEK